MTNISLSVPTSRISGRHTHRADTRPLPGGPSHSCTHFRTHDGEAAAAAAAAGAAAIEFCDPSVRSMSEGAADDDEAEVAAG